MEIDAKWDARILYPALIVKENEHIIPTRGTLSKHFSKLTMKILPLILTAFPIAASLSIISPVQAESSSSCSSALKAVQKMLQKKTIVSITPWDLSHEYTDHPKDRKSGYVIQLVVAEDTISTPGKESLSKEWYRAAEVMKSTKLQASLSTQIIQSCPHIGAVRFLLRQPRSSNWVNTFGLMGNGKVQSFTCRDDGQKWGEIFCV